MEEVSKVIGRVLNRLARRRVVEETSLAGCFFNHSDEMARMSGGLGAVGEIEAGEFAAVLQCQIVVSLRSGDGRFEAMHSDPFPIDHNLYGEFPIRLLEVDPDILPSETIWRAIAEYFVRDWFPREVQTSKLAVMLQCEGIVCSGRHLGSAVAPAAEFFSAGPDFRAKQPTPGLYSFVWEQKYSALPAIPHIFGVAACTQVISAVVEAVPIYMVDHDAARYTHDFSVHGYSPRLTADNLMPERIDIILGAFEDIPPISERKVCIAVVDDHGAAFRQRNGDGHIPTSKRPSGGGLPEGKFGGGNSRLTPGRTPPVCQQDLVEGSSSDAPPPVCVPRRVTPGPPLNENTPIRRQPRSVPHVQTGKETPLPPERNVGVISVRRQPNALGDNLLDPIGPTDATQDGEALERVRDDSSAAAANVGTHRRFSLRGDGVDPNGWRDRPCGRREFGSENGGRVCLNDLNGACQSASHAPYGADDGVHASFREHLAQSVKLLVDNPAGVFRLICRPNTRDQVISFDGLAAGQCFQDVAHLPRQSNATIAVNKEAAIEIERDHSTPARRSSARIDTQIAADSSVPTITPRAGPRSSSSS